ncbi:hypothetical protein [Corynebacterium rhinophilum]
MTIDFEAKEVQYCLYTAEVNTGQLNISVVFHERGAAKSTAASVYRL